MNSIESIERLNINSDNLAKEWRSFRQNFEIYSTATELQDKPEAVKIAIFLNVAGPEAIKVYNTFDKAEMEENSLARIVEEFERFCTVRRRNQLYDSLIFEKRRQTENETFHAFVEDLKRLIKFCGYKNEERMLRNRIVLGVYERDLQKRYFAKHQLDLNETIQMGCEVDEQSRSVQSLAGKQLEFQLHNKLCPYCNFKHAWNAMCPALGKMCVHCNKFNHYASVCPKKRQYDEELLAELTAQYGRS